VKCSCVKEDIFFFKYKRNNLPFCGKEEKDIKFGRLLSKGYYSALIFGNK
jgi:hypothetical protein